MSRRVRLATPADGPACAAIYRPHVVNGSTSFELEAPSGEEMGRRIAAVLERTPWLVAEDGNQILGYAYAGRHRERAAYAWTAETTIYVDESAHRQGVGRVLYGALLEALAVQGFHLAVAGITQPNPASGALHGALGFDRVGTYHRIGHKQGAWWDVAWFERELAPREAGPLPIVPLAEARDLPAFRAILEAASAALGG